MAPRKTRYKCWIPNNIILPFALLNDYILEKNANPLTYTTVGEIINYIVIITNTGQTDLSNIPLSDPFLNYNEIIASLPKGTTETINIGIHVVTQADIDTGSIINTIISNIKSSSVTVNAIQILSLTLIKSSTTLSFSAIGQIITYTYNINNNSNINLNNLILEDDKIGIIDTFNLAPGATTSLTANYIITQTDIDNGSVTNTAVVANNLISATDSLNIPRQIPFALSISKVANPITYDTIGQIITYTITVNNTGSDDMPAVNIIDSLIGLNITVPIASSQSHIGTGSYTVTQIDLDTGSITNTVSASGEGITVDTTQIINASQQPAVTLVKTSNPSGFNSIGQVVDYIYIITNTGNITLNNLQLTDDKLGFIGIYNNILPAASTTGIANYTITQADIDTGSITNEATVSNGIVLATDDLTINYTNIDFTVTKTALPTTYNTVGEVITYSFLITNTGIGDIINPRIVDPKLNLDTIINTTIIPGDNYTFTDTYTITQADIDTSSITNTATVEYIVSKSVSNTITAVQNPSLAITKVSDVSSFTEVGQIIGYQYTLTNNGNTTINNITVSDDKIPAPITTNLTLAPGAITSLNYSYITTAADVTNGFITNIVTASSGSITTNASVTIPYDQVSFTFTKTSSTPTFATVGQVITYTFTVTNTGSLPIVGPVVINDILIPTITPNNFNNIAVGASVTGTGTYTITLDDILNGSFANTASALDTATSISKTSNITITYNNPLLFIDTANITVPTGVIRFSYVLVGGGGAGGTATVPSTPIGGGGGGRSTPNINTITLIPGVNTITTSTGTGGSTNNSTGQGGNGTASTLTYNGITYTSNGGIGGYTNAEPNGGSVGGGGASPNGLGNPNGTNATISVGGNGGTGTANSGNLPYIFSTTAGSGGLGGSLVSTSRGLGGGGAGGLGALDSNIGGGNSSTITGGFGGKGYGAGGGGGSANLNSNPRLGGAGAIGIVTVQFS